MFSNQNTEANLPPITLQSGFSQQYAAYPTSEMGSAEQAKDKNDNIQINVHTSQASVTADASFNDNTHYTNLINVRRSVVDRSVAPEPPSNEDEVVQDWHVLALLDETLRRAQAFRTSPPKDNADLFILEALKSLASIVHSQGVKSNVPTNAKHQGEQQNRPFVNYVAPSVPSPLPANQMPVITVGHQSASNNTVSHTMTRNPFSITGNNASKARAEVKIPASATKIRAPRAKRQTRKKSIDTSTPKNIITSASFLTPQTNADFVNGQYGYSSAPPLCQTPSSLPLRLGATSNFGPPTFPLNMTSPSPAIAPVANDLSTKRAEISKAFRHQPYLNTYNKHRGQQLLTGNTPPQAVKAPESHHTVPVNSSSLLFTPPDTLTPGAGLAYLNQVHRFLQSRRADQAPSSQDLMSGNSAKTISSPSMNSFPSQLSPSPNVASQNYGSIRPAASINVPNYGNIQNKSSLPSNSMPSNQTQQLHRTENVLLQRKPMFNFNPQWINEQFKRRQTMASSSTQLPFSESTSRSADV